jgi:hypothetical protein
MGLRDAFRRLEQMFGLAGARRPLELAQGEPMTAHPGPLPNVGALVVARNFTRIAGLEARLDELRRTFQDRDDLPGIKLLLRALMLLCEGAKQKVVEQGRLVPAAFELPDEREFNGKDVPLNADLWGVTNALAELELALETWRDLLEAPQGPTFDAIAEPYIRLAKQIPNGSNVELIFKPVPVCRYQVLLNILPKFESVALNLRPSLRPLFASLPRLIAVEYPSSFEGDTFLHSAIAHEVGHIALVVGGFDDTIWTEQRVKHQLDDAPAIAQRKLWEELACDFLGVHLIGPAYALAFLEYSFAANLWKRPTAADHPDLAWRVAHLKQAVVPYLGDGAQSPEQQRAKQLLDQWLGLLPSSVPEDKPAVVDALDQVVARVDEILGPAHYRPELFRCEFDVAWRKLERRIAPAEVIFGRDLPRQESDGDAWSRPMDWRAIVNGGYFHYVSRHPVTAAPRHTTEATDRHAIRRQACSLIQGSIELSQLHRNMLDQRQQLAALEMGR